MADICVIAVGYNRPDAMNRLLNSLKVTDYEGDNIDLLISIDKGPRQKEVIDFSEKFEWKHGKKVVRAFQERQGLRQHIIQCGDVSADYKAVVVLEDDITVSPFFYSYIKQSLEFYKDDPKIAGISLYKHHINVGTVSFFEPEFIGYDTYLMQFAQSWGQCWTPIMWNRFKEWYEDNKDRIFDSQEFRSDLIPDNILQWGSHSWLKYYMAYIVEKDLFYVYPYHALSTNHSEVGQHNSVVSGDWQVSLVNNNFKYRFPAFENSVKYDIFFERIDQKISGYEDKVSVIDLYGNKKYFGGADIVISSTPRPYRVLETRKLKYRPHEVNCRCYEQGEGLYVYDIHSIANAPKATSNLIRTRYDVRAISWRNLSKVAISKFLDGIYFRIKSKRK